MDSTTSTTTTKTSKSLENAQKLENYTLEDLKKNHATYSFDKNGSSIGIKASKNFEQGDLIFYETSALTGPMNIEPRKPLTKYRPKTGEDVDKKICLGCCKVYGNSRVCSKCKWPVCSSNCELNNLHSNGECRLFENIKLKYSNYISNIKGKFNFSVNGFNYDLIRLLRFLLLKESNFTTYRVLGNLQSAQIVDKESPFSNQSDRKKADKEKNSPVSDAVKFIVRDCKLGSKFAPGEIKHILGILLANTEPLAYPLIEQRIECYSVSGIFPNYSRLSHSCKQNTRMILRDGNRLALIATVDIKYGELITRNFAEPFGTGGHYEILPKPLGTFLRRMILKNDFDVICSCKRCIDHLEGSVGISSVVCTGINCSNSSKYRKVKKFYSDPILPCDDDSVWKCSNTECNHTMYHEDDIAPTVEKVGQRLDKLILLMNVALGEFTFDCDEDSAECEELNCKKYLNVLWRVVEGLSWCEQFLHPNHFAILPIKFYFSVLSIWGIYRFQGRIPKVSLVRLTTINEGFGESGLEVSEKIEPGISVPKGKYMAIREISRWVRSVVQAHPFGEKWEGFDFQKIVLTPELEEARDILQWTTIWTPEWILYQLIDQNDPNGLKKWGNFLGEQLIPNNI